MSLRSDCTVDGYFAVVRRSDSTPTIRIFDGANRLISVLRCLNAAAVVHTSWQSRGRFLTCVFEDGVVLKFCKVTLRYELIYKLRFGSIENAIITKCGILVTTRSRSEAFLMGLFSALKGKVCFKKQKHKSFPLKILTSTFSSGMFYISDGEQVHCYMRCSVEVRNVSALSMSASPNGSLFALLCSDNCIQIFTADLSSCVSSYTPTQLSAHSSDWQLHWHTDSFLLATCMSSVSRIQNLFQFNVTSADLCHVHPRLFEIYLKLLHHRAGAYVNLHKIGLRQCWIHSSSLLEQVSYLSHVRIKSSCITNVFHEHHRVENCLRSWIEKITMHNLDSRTHPIGASSCNFHSGKGMHDRGNLAIRLLRSGRPYLCILASPQPMKRDVVSKWHLHSKFLENNDPECGALLVETKLKMHVPLHISWWFRLIQHNVASHEKDMFAKISSLKDANDKYKPSDGCTDKPVSKLWSDESLKEHYDRWMCAPLHAFHREAGTPPSDKLIIDIIEKYHAAGVAHKYMKSWHLLTRARSGHGIYTNTNVSSWLSTRTALSRQLVSGINSSLTKSAVFTVSDRSMELMRYEELAKHYVFDDSVSICLFLSTVPGNAKDLALVREIADAYAIMEKSCDSKKHVL